MKQFDITYFHGPFANYVVREDVIAEIASSGMTLMPLHYETETNKQALPILRRFGLRAIVSDPRIHRIYGADDIAGADAMAKEVVADYAEFDNIIGWDIVDEPNAKKFPILSAIVNAFRRYSPDLETVINLFPNYASAEQLGNSDYISHLEAFVNIVRPHLLSYDHYHFLGRQNRNEILDLEVDERERLIRLSAETTENRGGFFENIETFRSVALKYDIDQMLIVLLTEHGPYRNLTIGELYWEVNMCLAYGMKRISYFTYWEPSYDPHWQWTNAMCDTEGKKMQHWYDVREINAAISPAGRRLFNTTSEAVFHIGVPEEGAKRFEGYGAISAIDGENGVIGFFKDGSIYLVNRDFISDNTFTIHANKPLSILSDDRFIAADNCDITIELGAGEAVLLKV
ncbi:MAG: hypothetical protein IJY82_04170 [Oscillospiraceae bacterium]|nr:hypothetical protein [Oscillospiraceae bacterium]